MRIKTLLLVLAVFSLGVGYADAEKKPLDHDVYDGWQSLGSVNLTKDGSVLSYQIRPQEGDSKTFIRNTASGAELVIERAGTLSVSEDGLWAACMISAPYDTTRQMKIEKKKKDDMPADTLAYVNLRTLELKKVGPAKSFKIGFDAAPYIYAVIKSENKDKADDLMVISTADSGIDTLKAVSSYIVSKDGSKIAYLTKKSEKDSLSKNSVVLYKAAKQETVVLSEDKEDYCNLVFSESGSKLVFCATDEDSKKVGTAKYSLFLSEEVLLKKATRKAPAITELRTSEIVSSAVNGIPESWLLGKRSSPRFSNSEKRLVLTLEPYEPAKDTTVIDFESPSLDIWVWNSLTVPPMDKIRAPRLSRTAILNLDEPDKLLCLSANPNDRITLPAGADGDFAISQDTDAYELSHMWSDQNIQDISIIDLKDGSRRTLAEGLVGYTMLSTYGKYLFHFDSEGNWHSINIATGESVNLTAGLGVAFYDEEDDHPMALQPISSPLIVGEDEFVLLRDAYDVWKITPDGKKAVNLTSAYGRENSIVFSPMLLNRESNPFRYFTPNTYPKKGVVYLSAFGKEDSRNGFYTMNAAKASVPMGFLAEKSFPTVVKADDSDVLAFTKGDFRNPYDLYLTKLETDLSSSFESAKKLSAINPQQEDYVWGNVELVHWDAYDGTPLKGLLFTPDNLDKSKKYPMMIYFYEKYAETLYDYRAPAPSASTVNIPFFVSRGYVVFIPDIVYTPGHPGESAYNCICAGAEAMCEQYSFIDPKRMAIQGQSWGGYQTAYLVTRTDMFAAAGAGAPVSNMTSAYGGIRWESGSSRIPQYEYGQSRIGKRLWDEGGLDLYIENSPVFFSPKVNTPLLIMHNDADGAVPWYQGIEYFMSLRRLSKPVWLLQYNDEAHNLKERRNRKDLSIRLSQFFDHYLQGAPEPAWMRSGIPISRKGNYFGYENAE